MRKSTLALTSLVALLTLSAQAKGDDNVFQQAVKQSAKESTSYEKIYYDRKLFSMELGIPKGQAAGKSYQSSSGVSAMYSDSSFSYGIAYSQFLLEGDIRGNEVEFRYGKGQSNNTRIEPSIHFLTGIRRVVSLGSAVYVGAMVSGGLVSGNRINSFVFSRVDVGNNGQKVETKFMIGLSMGFGL